MATFSKRIGSDISSIFNSKIDSLFDNFSIEQKLRGVRTLEQRCHLCGCRGSCKPCPSYGTSSAKVLVLDANPGKLQEDSGEAIRYDAVSLKILGKLLHELGLTLNDIFLTYAFHCRVPERNIISYDKCSLWFNYEFSLLSNVDTIITLGEDAFHFVMGSGYPKVADIYGKHYVVNYNNRDIKVLPLMHPWFLLKNKKWMEETVSVLKKF